MEQIHEKYDVVIIGGGLGGLTAGAKLSKEGKKVLLLEQHNVPGGCATTYRHRDFRIEVGLHEMDGFKAGNFKQKIFSDLEVFGHVRFPEAPHFYRAVLDGGRDVTLPHDIAAARDLLTGLYPEERSGLEAYYFRMENYRKYKPAGEAEQQESIGAFLDRSIRDESLKLILLGNLMAFSDDPYLLAMDYYAQAQGTFYQSGGVFIEGGSQSLSDYLSGYISAHGGTVLMRHLAEEIMVEGDRCTGVKYRSLKDGSEHRVEARFVVANAALPQVAERLLPPEAGRPILEATASRPPGASLFTLYMAFSKPLKELGNPCYCTCVYGPEVRAQRDIGPNSRGYFGKKTFVLTDYSHIESGLSPEGTSVAALVAEDYLSYWEGLDPATYKHRKEEVTRSFLGRLESLIPGFRNHLVWYDAATARTIERYTLNTEGAVYGYAQLPGPRARPGFIPLKNLYIASAWDKFGGGFSGVIYSGYFAAMDLLRSERINKQ